MAGEGSRVQRWLAALLIAGGTASALFSLFADLIIGGSPGFGLRQWMLLGGGGLLVLAGSWLTATGRQSIRASLRSAFEADVRLGPGRILALAVALGVFTGLVEVGVLFGDRKLTGRILRMGGEATWVIPLVNVLILSTIGLLLSAGSLLWRGLRSAYVVTFVMMLLCADALLHRFTLGDRLDAGSAWLLAGGVAAAMTRGLAGRFRRGLRLRRGALVAALLGLLVPAVVVGTAAVRERLRLSGMPEPGEDAPNVLLIIWDTVRSANLSLHGYDRPTTPNLDRWAASGTVFDFALSTASWTLPAHASLFTGRYPNELSTDWWAPLDGEHATLAEVLSDHGWATGGFSANLAYATREVGLARGFTHFEDYDAVPGRMVLESTMLLNNIRRLGFVTDFEASILGLKRADRITQATLDWLSSGSVRGRPFFAFLNYFDAHDPYVSTAPYDTLFGPVEPWFFRGGMGHKETDPAKIRPQRDAYDRSIAYLDAQFGELMRGLEARGLRDNTIVIFTSDHGEHFGEHGFMRHGNTLYLPVLHVPLVVHDPRRAPAGVRVAEPVTLRDVAATILDLAGIGRVERRIPGASLARFWEDPATAPRQEPPLYAEVREGLRIPPGLPNSDADLRALVGDGFHFIWQSDGHEELYDISADPGEMRNLTTQDSARDVLTRMRAELARFVDPGERIAGTARAPR